MTPHEAADEKVRLAGTYSRLSQQLEEIRLAKPDKWLAIRKDAKSDKAADRVWDASEDGKTELKLSMAMKRMEKQISALNSLIRVCENESKHGW